MATEKLDIMQTIKDGVRYGLKNFFPLLLNRILNRSQPARKRKRENISATLS